MGRLDHRHDRRGLKRLHRVLANDRVDLSGSREIIATTHRLSRYPIGATLVGAFVAAPRRRRRQEPLALKFVFWDNGES